MNLCTIFTIVFLWKINMNWASQKHFWEIKSQTPINNKKMMYLSWEGFEKDATELCVNWILFNIFNNDLLLKICDLSLERGRR